MSQLKVKDTSSNNTVIETQTYKKHYLLDRQNFIALCGISILTTSSIIYSNLDTNNDESFSNYIHKVNPRLVTEPADQFLSTESTDADDLKYQHLKLGLVHEINKFSSLKSNWNGYNAEPISKEVVDNAISMIFNLQGIPQVFPTARNSIQIEFENFQNGNYLEIEVFENKSFVYSSIDGIEKDTIEVTNLDLINKDISLIDVA